MLTKPLNIILIIIAAAIVLIYITGYSYLFRGIKLTYLRGKTSSTIDDGQFFPSRIIEKGTARPWPHDINYNKKTLSPELQKHLQETESVTFLVIHRGQLLQEHYWDNYNQATASNSFSMAKTLTTLLLGAAIDDRKIPSVEQNVSNYFPEFSKDSYGKALTLENLATMEAGLDWKEDYQNPFLPNAAAYYGFSVAEVVLKTKMAQMPGEHFEYQSGATQLLGLAIGKAIGFPLSYYASLKLWKPLGMEQNAQWITDDTGIEKSFCCIDSNARDWAKIGLLLLNHGKVDNVPIINEMFIQKMITPTEHSNGIYGMGVWTNYDYKIPHYYLRGLWGQYVIVVPEQELIIVRLGNKDDKTEDSKGRPKEVELYINESLKLIN